MVWKFHLSPTLQQIDLNKLVINSSVYCSAVDPNNISSGFQSHASQLRITYLVRHVAKHSIFVHKFPCIVCEVSPNQTLQVGIPNV